MKQTSMFKHTLIIIQEPNQINHKWLPYYKTTCLKTYSHYVVSQLSQDGKVSYEVKVMSCAILKYLNKF